MRPATTGEGGKVLAEEGGRCCNCDDALTLLGVIGGDCDGDGDVVLTFLVLGLIVFLSLLYPLPCERGPRPLPPHPCAFFAVLFLAISAVLCTDIHPSLPSLTLMPFAKL